MREKSRLFVGLVVWLSISFVAAGIGATASVQASAFYAQITQPAWAPPAAVFGPVWSLLYALMGIGAWLVWRTGDLRATRVALALFLVQLALNSLWSWLFFGWHLGAYAFADILLLWALIIATLVAFQRHSPLAAALLVPYLLWVSFAAVLNYSIWQLNPRFLG